jgi:hypothetical protein
MAPFVEQHLHDGQLVPVAEDAAVDALFHDRQRVADGQLVSGEAAVAVAGTRFGDDAADAAQRAAVGDDLDFGGQRDEAFQRQCRVAGDAGDTVLDAAADGLGAGDLLRQQRIVGQALRMRQPQAQRAVRGAQ